MSVIMCIYLQYPIVNNETRRSNSLDGLELLNHSKIQKAHQLSDFQYLIFR